MYEVCQKHNWLRADRGLSYFQSSNIQHPNFSLKELKNIRDYFGYEVFKEYNYKRALIDLVDKSLLKSRLYQNLRSFLIRQGIKKFL